jgi:hypothetical protein
MATAKASTRWLFLLTQLPSSPSSARVALWRRLRAAGAAGMLNGAWVLPHTDAHVRLFEELRTTVCEQGGRALVLAVQETPPDTERAIVERFRADRGREYDEFAERCAAFLTEVRKETRARKFTFAELEEGEHDLEKLLRWLAKISARDFFPDERAAQAREMAQGCQRALEDFSRLVYEAEGIQHL